MEKGASTAKIDQLESRIGSDKKNNPNLYPYFMECSIVDRQAAD
jgi:hypothetical protein